MTTFNTARPVSSRDDVSVGTARDAVRTAAKKGWRNAGPVELRAAHAWLETKSAQETASWPITTAVVGAAAVGTAYVVDHGLGGWEAVLGSSLILLVAAVAAACAFLTAYRLVAMWVYERRHAEVAYWLARRDAEVQQRGPLDGR